MSVETYLSEAMAVLDRMRQADSARRVEAAAQLIARALSDGRPLLVCGNGGSAADALHIAGELVGRYLKERRAYKCIALTADSSVLTAWSNDYGFETVFSRQVEAYGEPGGVVLGLSTSGNSPNVVEAFRKAREMEMSTVAFTGEGGGALKPLSDLLIDVPSRRTPEIQQVHVCLYHYLCGRIEDLLA
ncbi:MAG: SIS domain-containing protein [Rhodospirillales bacterium]|nr:SIS domain-containing protein [Rhodospirillales bacterium]